MTWNVGDWVVFEMSVGQIKELRGGGCVSFSDGFFETSGMLLDRFRPLTLKSKCTVETFETYYRRLREIDGEAGFNYPDIHRHFSALALSAIDAEDGKEFFEAAQEFVREAQDYKNPIQGIRLFRPKIGRR